MIRPLPHASALVIALAVSAASARAEETQVVIEHEPITSTQAGAPLKIRARIRTQAGRTPFEPTVFVRVAGIVGFTRIAMRPVPSTDGQFEAEVPATLITGDFDYYLESYDSAGDGPGRVGAPEAPLRVLIRAAAPAPTDKPLAPQLEPRPLALETVVVSQQSRPALRSRSQLPTFALFAATGLCLGLAVAATVGNQVLKGDLEDPENHQMNARWFQASGTLEMVSVGGFVATGAFLTSGIVYLAWPDGEPEAEVGGKDR